MPTKNAYHWGMRRWYHELAHEWNILWDKQKLDLLQLVVDFSKTHYQIGGGWKDFGFFLDLIYQLWKEKIVMDFEKILEIFLEIDSLEEESLLGMPMKPYAVPSKWSARWKIS